MYYYFSVSKHKGLSIIIIFICQVARESHVLIFLCVQTQGIVTYYYFYMPNRKGKSRINIFMYPNTTDWHLLIFLYAKTTWKITY
jgi:hypothetical protein